MRPGVLPLVVTLLAGVASPGRAQTSRADPTDLQSWLGAGLHLDMPNSWEASLQYRLRRVDNASQVRGSYVTGELQFRPASVLTLLGSYRLALVDNGTFHRYALGSEVKGEFGRNEVGLRAMAQYQRQNFADNDEQSSDEDTFVRTRFRLERAVSEAVDLYVSTEPYFKMGGGGHAIDNWRNTLGAKVAYAKGRKLDVFYIYRPDYGKRTYNRTFHIIGVDLDFDMKVGGRKKATKAGK